MTLSCQNISDWYRAGVTTLLIATRNLHKVGEIQAILGSAFQMLTLDDFPGAPKVVEDAETFAGNASKKAVTLATWLNSNPSLRETHPQPAFVLADDSGLEVDALGGAPGVHSARFAALDKHENSPDVDNNAKLLQLLKSVPEEKRTARFRCVVALARMTDVPGENASPVCYAENSETITSVFDGACEGKIIGSPRGRNGFGYDPLFVPAGFDQTFAELGDETKNQLSHRAKALAKLRAHFNKLVI
jgi:XTP/dITP diphosphohydrolase